MKTTYLSSLDAVSNHLRMRRTLREMIEKFRVTRRNIGNSPTRDAKDREEITRLMLTPKNSAVCLRVGSAPPPALSLM